MTCNELLASCKTHNIELLERGKAAASRFDEEAWNAAPKGSWSPAQIFQHLILSNRDYVTIIGERLKSPPSGGDAPVRHSFFGRIILKSAGPDGNGPVPKPFMPPPGPYSREVLETWSAQQEQIIALHDKAKDVDLTAIRYPVPLMKIFKLSMCDSFAIFAAHTERHIRQIEARIPK